MPRLLASLNERLGVPAVFVFSATVLAAIVLGVLPAVPQADQRVWTFAQTHADALVAGEPSPLDVYERESGRSVGVDVLDRRAMDVRLGTLLAGGAGLPDVVQLDVASATRMLNASGTPPFEPLDDLVPAATLGRFLPSRLALWRRNGTAYGLPADVHAVALAYRVDLWDEVGLDPTSAATWTEFAALCREYHDRRTARGEGQMAALEVSRTASDHVTLVLQQAGYDVSTSLEQDVVADVILTLAGLLSDGAAKPTSAGHGRWADDFAAGDVATLWMPDWRSQYLRLGAPGLAGDVALMPLPRWTPQGPPTAGWGATMLAIPRGVEDRAAAAELLAFVAASPEVIAGRTRSSDMMPPLADTSVESGDDPFYVTGPPRRLFAELAPFVDLPPSDANFLRKAANLGLALEATTADLEAGEPEAAVRGRLEDRLANPL